MSEYINNSEKRVEDLLAFSLGVMSGENVKDLIDKYSEAINNITPHDMLKLEDRQMRMGITPEAIKKDVEKVINVFYKSLKNYQWEKPDTGTFLYYLMLENSAFTFKLNQVKKILKNYKGRESSNFGEIKRELLPRFKEFFDFEQHYVKKENILFPYLEKIWENYRPLNVMWSLHDDIRKSLKKLVSMLEDRQSEWEEFSKILGKYYFLVFGMIQKEDLIVYPVASETVPEEAREEMQLQSFEYPFPFIEPPEKPESKQLNVQAESGREFPEGAGIRSETGFMSAEQAMFIFNTLPVDITFVDENDKVCFFNRAKERLFPRSPAIVGRTVQNCHPPESVHVVEKIIESFRSGKKDHADFWIQMKGKFILIQYFAIRDEEGQYKGVLEVSQEVTEIRRLEGEKRLLDWE
jgi:PAS domain S-box-containing protein